jgi:hypothetical protein
MTACFNSDLNRLFCPRLEILPVTVFVRWYLFALDLLAAAIHYIQKTTLTRHVKSDVVHDGYLLTVISKRLITG